jgi:hypothetical protein
MTLRAGLFFVIPFYFQSVLVHSANCVKHAYKYTVAQTEGV